MESDEGEDEEERLRTAAVKNAESIRIARQRAQRELLAAKEALVRKTEELQQQREWFEVTLSSIGDAVITTDVQGMVTYLNPVAESITGWTSAEAGGEPLERVFRIVNEYTRQAVDNPIGKVLQTGKIVGLANHTALIDKNGRMVPIEDSAAPIRDAQGTVVGAVMVFHDVSDRRRVEDALRASEERLRATFNQAAVGIVVADLNGRLLETNRRFCDILGYSFDELQQFTFTQIVHPEDLSRAQAQTRALRAGETPHCAFENRYIRKGGATLWGRTTLALVKEAGGEAQRIIGVVEDITDRKDTEQALRDSQAQAQEIRSGLAAIVESSDDAIISKTLEGVITTWNRGAERIFGYTAEEVIGKPVTLLIPPNQIDEEPAILQKLRRGERIDHYETVRMRKDGTLLDVSLTVSPVKDLNGTIIGASKIARDTTQRKRTEAALLEEIAIRERAEAALREADRRKDEFLALLAHELRNPLAPIRYALAGNKKARRTSEQRKRAEEIVERQVTHMSRLLDDLLDISRISRGTLELKTNPTELALAVRTAIETARPFLDAKHHTLSLDLPKAAVRLEADSVRLAQAFSNLLINAAKYTDPGGDIRLRAAQEGHEVVVTIRDNGIGIAADMMPRLFTLFSQAQTALGRAEGGLGIGLSLVRGVVTLHGGSVEARSDGPGTGSEFIVRLPIGAPLEVTDMDATAENPAPGAGLKILVVDDNRDAADACASLLELSGHHVQTAYTGQHAVALAETFRPHALLLDIGLPDFNGYELAAKIRASPWGRDVMLIAVTGWGQEEDRRRALEAGCDHHLTKPVAPETVESLLQSLDPAFRSIK
jgi:PAS domain S-box-containing protein